jgi:hypothetical protein
MLKFIIIAVVVLAIIAFKKVSDAQKDESGPSTIDKLPSTVRTTVSKLSAANQNAFFIDYDAKKKKTSTAYIAWFFWVEYLYLGRTGAFFGKLAAHFLFLIPGIVWQTVNLFKVPKMVAEYNAGVARTVIQDISIGNQVADVSLSA